MKMRRASLFPLFLVLLAKTSLFGQFGQNIVQYDHYEWQYIQTPQFDIYFYGDNMELAEFASAAATESYEQISDRLNCNNSNRKCQSAWSAQFPGKHKNLSTAEPQPRVTLN